MTATPDPSAATSARAPVTTLADLARVVRSKNAGPTQLTLDLFFRDQAGFERAQAAPGLRPAEVAARYGVKASQVRRFDMPALLAIKLSLPRRLCAGSPGDGDVYGAQQHVPLLEVVL
jgi:hypothetical protein